MACDRATDLPPPTRCSLETARETGSQHRRCCTRVHPGAMKRHDGGVRSHLAALGTDEAEHQVLRRHVLLQVVHLQGHRLRHGHRKVMTAQHEHGS